MKLISRGAEANIYSAYGRVIKHRISKGYRIPEIDERLRKFRTRREAKVLERLHELGILVPRLISASDKSMKLVMENIGGSRLGDILSSSNCRNYCLQLGSVAAKLHENSVIHGDLTTSNMIVNHKNLYLIDFGLSFFSGRVEDMAVDIHLFKQSLFSRHPHVAEKCFNSFVDAYSKSKKDAKTVFGRLAVVEQRGRYKLKS